MSRRTRRLPRAPRRSRTAGARAALVCALASALLLTGLGVTVPASAATPVIRSFSVAEAGHPAPHRKKQHRRAATRHHAQKAKKPAMTKASKASKRERHKHKHRRRHRPVWSPRDGTIFNYPFSPRIEDRFRVRRHILDAVKGSPRGSRILLASFSFFDAKLARALIAAHRRGVTVQVLVNRKDANLSPPFQHLRKALGHSLRGHPRTARSRASFARTCAFSCRGSHGNLHAKIYLFSQVGHRRWVSMVGSANLTKFAAENQWNHLNTITGKPTYVRLRHVFDQMRRDHRQRHPFEKFATPKTVTWVFPRLHTTVRQDPMMRILSRVDCQAAPHTGIKVPVKHPKRKHQKHRHQHRQHHGITRRTVIRISMYAWFDNRGDALARAVRQKWNQGCDVRVVYSVLNGKVKRILYDPSGRGRIPMRRSVVPDYLGHVTSYNHSKYVVVNGSFAGKGRRLVWTGSMNFTQLGLTSDDIIVRLAGRRVYHSYLANFRRVWHAPTARIPLPTRPFTG